MSDKPHDVLGVLNMLILLGGGVGAFLYLSDMVNENATKEFHHADMQVQHEALVETLDDKLAPIKVAAEQSESNSLPPRIVNLLKLQCRDPNDFIAADLNRVLHTAMDRYKELNGRDYRRGTCDEGVYLNVRGEVVD